MPSEGASAQQEMWEAKEEPVSMPATAVRFGVSPTNHQQLRDRPEVRSERCFVFLCLGSESLG